MDWPISMGEAARRVEVDPKTASILIRSHHLPTERIPGAPKFVGLMPETFERFRELAEPFRRKARSKPA